MMGKKKYVTAYADCQKRPCFVPFEGNGVATCRLYEVGQCKNLPVPKRKPPSMKQVTVECDDKNWEERGYLQEEERY